MRTAVFAAFIVALAGVVASEAALAHGRTRVTVGVGVGFGYPYWASPFWGPWYYPPPYYYHPVPVVVSPPPPVTYVEQGHSGNWWYYCETAKGYYPYVKECPTGWQRVPPTPPGSK
jgi:hypothetical protein